MKVARPGEVHQDLHYAVQAVNFTVNDVHVAAGVRVRLQQLVLQKLQVQDDGVDGVLDLVGDTARDAAAGGETAGGFDFIFYTTDRFGVVHGKQCADLGATFMDKIQCHLDTFSSAGFNFVLSEGPAQLKPFQHERAQGRAGRKNLSYGFSQQRLPWRA